MHQHMPFVHNMDLRSNGPVRRPIGFRPIGFGFPLLGGFLGGLAAGALLRPPYPYYYPPFPPPFPPPYYYYGGYW